MKMTVTSAQRTFTATLKTILPYNLFLPYLYIEIDNRVYCRVYTDHRVESISRSVAWRLDSGLWIMLFMNCEKVTSGDRPV